MENIEILKEASENFNKKNSDNIYKFTPSIAYASPGAYDILKRYGIKLTKPSQFIVLTQDPKTLLQILDLAEKMKFIDAYREDPKRLTQLVTNVIKRMAKCEAMHIPYRDEKGRVLSWLFSERGYNAYMISLGKEVVTSPNETVSSGVVITPPEGFFNRGNGVTPSADFFNTGNGTLDKVKEYALRVLEQFGITEQKDMIYNQIDQLQNSGLGIKEMLLEAFKSCAGNIDLVSDTIDELLEQDKNLVLGGSAA